MIGGIMKLKVMERIALLTVLPAEGNFQTLKLLRVLKEALSFTEEENALLNIKQVGEMVTWDPDYDIPIEFDIPDILADIIRTTLDDLDAKKKLTESHIPLWEKFFDEVA
jgi:hypothetical protein